MYGVEQVEGVIWSKKDNDCDPLLSWTMDAERWAICWRKLTCCSLVPLLIRSCSDFCCPSLRRPNSSQGG